MPRGAHARARNRPQLTCGFSAQPASPRSQRRNDMPIEPKEKKTIIIGTDHEDHLTGTDRGDSISAGGGSDVIDGGKGDDVMEGGFGDDTYYVDSQLDVVI